MKLKSQNKTKKIVIISVVSLVALILISLVGLVIYSANNPTSLLGIIVNNALGGNNPLIQTEILYIEMIDYPKRDYYVGDKFDSTGASIQVVANTEEGCYFVDYTKLKFSGFDSSVANDALVITVTYKEFTTTFNVKITERPAPPAQKTLESIEVSDDFVSTFSKSAWSKFGPAFNGANYEAKLILHFSDGSEVEIGGLKNYCAIDYSWGVGQHDLIFSYTYSGKTVTCTVPITITN